MTSATYQGYFYITIHHIYFNNLLLATSCDICDIGYISRNGKSVSGCSKCEEGTTTSSTMSTFCNICDVDYYSPSGAPPCIHCPIGMTTKSNKGQTNCVLESTGISAPPTPPPSPCLQNSVLYLDGNCWCNKNYKSSNGLAPCVPCGNNSFSNVIGASKCACNKNLFSDDGFDSYNGTCRECPEYTFTIGTGTVGANASEACRCGTSSGLSWEYYSGYIEQFIDGSIIPAVGTTSTTGMAPCIACDNNTLPITEQQGWWSPHPFIGYIYNYNYKCICKPGYKTLVAGGGLFIAL